MDEYNNKVQVVCLDEDSSEFTCRSTFDHDKNHVDPDNVSEQISSVIRDNIACSPSVAHFRCLQY